MEIVIHAFISSCLDYCNSLFIYLSKTILDQLQLDQLIQVQMLLQTLHGQTPSYISKLLQPYVTSRTLRSSDQGLLSVPQSRLKTKGNAFVAMAPKLWNSLPSNLRSLDSVDSFKKQLKIHLFRLAFG
ncbi:hypothetical protein LDENG_00190890 [Lucifuga dentata]|nr:hypothetical protein LDENG_00190890 [Lucifuga dentata]